MCEIKIKEEDKQRFKKENKENSKALHNYLMGDD